jgi:hypothetical protein
MIKITINLDGRLHPDARTARTARASAEPAGRGQAGAQRPRPGRLEGARRPGGGAQRPYRVGKGEAGVGSLHPQQRLVPVVQEVVDFETVVQQRLLPELRHQSEVVLRRGEDEELANVPGSARHDLADRERRGEGGNDQRETGGIAELGSDSARPTWPQRFAVARGGRYGDRAFPQRREAGVLSRARARKAHSAWGARGRRKRARARRALCNLAAWSCLVALFRSSMIL